MNTLAVPTMYLTRSISEVPKSPMVKSFVSKTNGACHVGRLVKSHFETFFHPIQFLLHQDCICGGYSMKERMEEYKRVANSSQQLRQEQQMLKNFFLLSLTYNANMKMMMSDLLACWFLYGPFTQIFFLKKWANPGLFLFTFVLFFEIEKSVVGVLGI